jgi:hypothetical protein
MGNGASNLKQIWTIISINILHFCRLFWVMHDRRAFAVVPDLERDPIVSFILCCVKLASHLTICQLDYKLRNTHFPEGENCKWQLQQLNVDHQYL